MGTIMRKTVKLKSQLGDTGGAPGRADMQSASRRSIGDLHEDEHPHCSAGPAPLLLHDYRAIRCIPQKHLRIPTGEYCSLQATSIIPAFTGKV